MPLINGIPLGKDKHFKEFVRVRNKMRDGMQLTVKEQLFHDEAIANRHNNY